VVTLQVCLVSSPNVPVTVVFRSSAMLRATAAPAGGTFAAVGDCQTVTLTDIVDAPGTTSGQVRLQTLVGGVIIDESENITFPGTPAAPPTL